MILKAFAIVNLHCCVILISSENVVYKDSRFLRLWRNNYSYDLSLVGYVRVLLRSIPNFPFCLFFYSVNQARNQLGTPGGAKSFLREAQIFWTMSNTFKLYPTHFSREGEKFSRWALPPPPPWLWAWRKLLCNAWCYPIKFYRKCCKVAIVP